MVGSVLTSSSSITRGLVRARYALALRANPGPEARVGFNGVSVVLTVAVTRSVWQLRLAMQLRSCGPDPGTALRGGNMPGACNSRGTPGGDNDARPALASEYHTALPAVSRPGNMRR